MSHWWVNHNQTAKQEVEGGYVWSPKRESNGSRSQYYDYMREMRPGDYVVSFANSQIGHCGVVSGFPLSAPKPDEFGDAGENWSNDGWLVPVVWSSIPTPFRPKDNIEQIRDFLPEKYSPIQTSGNGNQKAYMTKIGEELFQTLEELGGFEAHDLASSLSNVNDRHIIEAIEDQIQTNLEDDTSIDQTEKEALVKSRRGQGKFRTNVEKVEKKCRVTGLSDGRLLIASHIKPWRACETAFERLDGANGLLLAPHIDRLFDLGLITFTKDGKLIASETLSAETADCLGLANAMSSGVGAFSSQQEAYLSYHRNSVFIG